jgi:hypothetical protein
VLGALQVGVAGSWSGLSKVLGSLTVRVRCLLLIPSALSSSRLDFYFSLVLLRSNVGISCRANCQVVSMSYATVKG